MRKIWLGIKAFKKKIAAKRRSFLAARPHRSFKKTRRPRTQPGLINIKQNTIETFKTIWQDKTLFGGLMVVYVVMTSIFVGSIAQADFVELKEATLEVFGGKLDSFDTLVWLVSSTMSGAFSGGLSELQQFLSAALAVFFWLSVIWALRMRFANQKINIRDALYNSGAPVLAYLLVGFFVILQLTPGAFGIAVLSIAQSGGFLQNGVELMMFSGAALLLCCLSVYWLSASLTALVVVTLPQMYPWRALQISSELAIGRRLRLVKHIVALVAMLIVTWAVVLVAVLFIDGLLRFNWLPLLPLAVQVLGAWTIVFTGAYVYRVYRSML